MWFSGCWENTVMFLEDPLEANESEYGDVLIKQQPFLLFALLFKNRKNRKGKESGISVEQGQ